jgi:hypothetical protein
MKVNKSNIDFFYALNQFIKNIEKEDKDIFNRLYSGKQGELDRNLMSIYYPKILKFDEVGVFLNAFLKLSKTKRKDLISSSVWKRKVFEKIEMRFEVEDIEEINLSSYKRLSACKKHLEYLFVIMIHTRWAFICISKYDYNFCKYIVNNATRNMLAWNVLKKAIDWGIKINPKNIFQTNSYDLINTYFKSLSLDQRKKQIKNYKGRNKRIRNRLSLLSKSCSEEYFKEACFNCIESNYSFSMVNAHFRAGYFNHISQEARLEVIFDLSDKYSDKYISPKDLPYSDQAKSMIRYLIATLKKEYKIFCLSVLKNMGDIDSAQSRYLLAFMSSDTSIL